jgi:hypothetical protein
MLEATTFCSVDSLRFFCRSKIYTNYLLLCTLTVSVVLFQTQTHLIKFLAILLNIFTFFPAYLRKHMPGADVRVFKWVDFWQHYQNLNWIFLFHLL